MAGGTFEQLEDTLTGTKAAETRQSRVHPTWKPVRNGLALGARVPGAGIAFGGAQERGLLAHEEVEGRGNREA